MCIHVMMAEAHSMHWASSNVGLARTIYHTNNSNENAIKAVARGPTDTWVSFDNILAHTNVRIRRECLKC